MFIVIFAGLLFKIFCYTACEDSYLFRSVCYFSCLPPVCLKLDLISVPPQYCRVLCTKYDSCLCAQQVNIYPTQRVDLTRNVQGAQQL